ncbi:MAG: response regulator [Sphingomonadales bacterium]|nr:response regulator [Sphingomonadales bacterium]
MTSAVMARRGFTELPFRTKLTLLTLTGTAIALLVSCLGLIGMQIHNQRLAAQQRYGQIASVLSSNLGAAVVFNDPVAADKILASVHSVPDIEWSAVINLQGHVVGHYAATQSGAGQPAVRLQSVLATCGNAADPVWGSDDESLCVPVRIDDGKVGVLVLGLQNRALVKILSDNIGIAILLFGLCLGVGYSVSAILQRMVFRPLDRLQQTMRKIGSSGDYQMRLQPFSDPDFNQIIGSFNAMLDEIARRNDALSDTMGQLRAAHDRAEHANIAKSQFLANMSHELRTPLNAIIGYTEVLQDELEQRGNTRSLEDVKWVYSSAQQLLELINGLLDLSKIEAGRMEVEICSFDIRKLLREVEALLLPLAAAKQNTLVMEIDDTVTAANNDSTKLRQCLLNLGSNACKFTEGGFVHIHARNDGDDLVFDVADTGIGLTEAEAQKLFQPFVQSDTSTTRKYGGTGLGLAITSRFATMMGGAATVVSTPRVGSTFTVRIASDLARKRAEGDTEVKVDTSTIEDVEVCAPRPRPVALVMEDEPSSVELLRRLLERKGYDTVVAGDGAAGLAMASKSPPDVILLDIGLPRFDGWQVLEALREDPRLQAIPTVVVSVDDRRRKSMDEGASDHLVKPLDRAELDAVLSLYEQRRSGRILLVEDDEATRRLYERGIGQCGYAVTCARNGLEALERLAEAEFDLVVTDLMMPKLDGHGLIAAIGEIDMPRRPAVVVMTGKPLSHDEERGLGGKVDAILAKGELSPRRLATKIGTLVRQPNEEQV